MKNGVDIELGKTNRLKALRMMENHTLNKQTMCQQPREGMKTKINGKKKLCKQSALDKAVSNIK